MSLRCSASASSLSIRPGSRCSPSRFRSIIYGRLDERQFRQMLALLLVVSGLTLIV